MNPIDQGMNPSDPDSTNQSYGSPNDGGSNLPSTEPQRLDHRSEQQPSAGAQPDQITTGITNQGLSGGISSGLSALGNPQRQLPVGSLPQIPAPNQAEAQLSEIRRMMMQLVDRAQENERIMQQLASRQQQFEEVTRSLTTSTQPSQRQGSGVTFRDLITDPSFPRGRLEFSPNSVVPDGQGPVFQTPLAGTVPAFNPPVTSAMGTNVATTSSIPDQVPDQSTRLPPPPPIFRSGGGTSIPSGGRTSASVYQARDLTPNPEAHRRAEAVSTAYPSLPVDLTHRSNPGTRERLSSPATWENDQAWLRQEPARQIPNSDPAVLPLEGPEAIRRYMEQTHAALQKLNA